MGSAWTCGCRGGKIIPLRPDVRRPAEAGQPGGSSGPARQSGERTLRWTPTAQPVRRASGSMKPQQRTPFEGPFMVLLWALTFVVLEGLTVQAGGQVASWAFGEHRVVFGPIGAGASISGAGASSGRSRIGMESEFPVVPARTHGPVGLVVRHAPRRSRTRRRGRPIGPAPRGNDRFSTRRSGEGE